LPSVPEVPSHRLGEAALAVGVVVCWRVRSCGNAIIAHYRIGSCCSFDVRVKLRRTQYEYMFSALLSNSDIARCSRHVCFVPDSFWDAPGIGSTST
jgi:hypothetical protein